MKKTIISMILGFSVGSIAGCSTFFCYGDCDVQHEEDLQKCGNDEDCIKEANLKAYHCNVKCAKSAETIRNETTSSSSTSTSGTPTTTNETSESTTSPVNIFEEFKYPE